MPPALLNTTLTDRSETSYGSVAHDAFTRDLSAVHDGLSLSKFIVIAISLPLSHVNLSSA